nr:hypothetical protein [Tanacetum cinerariifolium]
AAAAGPAAGLRAGPRPQPPQAAAGGRGEPAAGAAAYSHRFLPATGL